MAKTLEILRWACYNVDVGCRYPPKMPYMGCILLLMQPAPLTGTATSQIFAPFSKLRMQPAPLTGTATAPEASPPPGLSDAARTPHGDGNKIGTGPNMSIFPMQPAPLTGTATRVSRVTSDGWVVDAARTPHGDGNRIIPAILINCNTMQPAPLTGTATQKRRGRTKTSVPFLSQHESAPQLRAAFGGRAGCVSGEHRQSGRAPDGNSNRQLIYRRPILW